MTKRVSALIKGISKFIDDFGVTPDIALMHPTTKAQLNKELVQFEQSSDVRLAISKTEIKVDSDVDKSNILFLMKDGSL